MVEVNIQLKRKEFQLQIQEKFTADITGVFGPSGAGKTSLLKTIAGLVNPDSGSVLINDVTLFDSKKKINVPVEKRNVGYVFQEGRLFPHLTVAQNLKYGINKEDEPLISFDELINVLELQSLLNKKTHQISGGEQQRTALGRALLSSPRILLLDEPFSALDNLLKKQLLSYLLKIQALVKIPVFIVSHSLSDLLKITSHLCILEKGKSLGNDHFFELIKSPRISKYLDKNDFLNTIDVHFSKKNNHLVWSKNNKEVVFSLEVHSDKIANDTPLKLYIKPNEISLAKEEVKQITIQNQLRGEIKEVIKNETSVFCVVNVGFLLLVEISYKALEQLDLKIGGEIWCLFKSVAVEINEK